MCVTRLIKTLLFAIKKVNVRKIFCFFTTGAVLKENTKEPGVGAQVKGVGVRAWNSFSSATRACLFIHVVSKRKNTFTLVLAIFCGQKRVLFFSFFYFTKSSALSLSHPTPHPSTIKIEWSLTYCFQTGAILNPAGI